MTKGERISQFVAELEGASADARPLETSEHPCYRGFFRCWNERRYDEAHYVLEHLWLETTSDDAQYFKGLIQAAGAFVHLQKNFEHLEHPKHARRLAPAARLIRLAGMNLSPFAPVRHGFDVAGLLRLLEETGSRIVRPSLSENPWSPASAPQLLVPARHSTDSS